MQLAMKVVRLELFYNHAASQRFLHEIRYLSPFFAEEVEHFCLRLLSLLSLYEFAPALAVNAGKGPDLFVKDEHSHYRLWCQVAVPNDKQLQRACHQSDQVLLMLSEYEQKKYLQGHKQSANLQICGISADTLTDFARMLKANMQLSVWRDDDTLQITDGQQLLEFAAPQVNTTLH